MHTNVDFVKKMEVSGILDSGGGFNPFVSEVVNSVIGLGFLNTHIRIIHINQIFKMSPAQLSPHCRDNRFVRKSLCSKFQRADILCG